MSNFSSVARHQQEGAGQAGDANHGNPSLNQTASLHTSIDSLPADIQKASFGISDERQGVFNQFLILWFCIFVYCRQITVSLSLNLKFILKVSLFARVYRALHLLHQTSQSGKQLQSSSRPAARRSAHQMIKGTGWG